MQILKPKPKILDTQEVFNLWDVLRSRYQGIEQIQIFQNFIHDHDFNLLIKVTLYEMFETQANELEQLMNNYGIMLPRRPPKSVRTPANTQAINDKFLAGMVISLLQENISSQLRAIRTSLTTDGLRKTFVKQLKEEIPIYDDAIKYIKLKGWLDASPIYPHVPTGTVEKLDSGEAFHLWDHLGARYDSLEITQIFKNYSHDPDFGTLLLMGLLTVLENQINMLEKELDHFGLPLPNRPAKSAKTIMNAEILEDEIIYRNVFTGMQFILELHATALKQSSTNDRLRTLYIKLLWKELDLMDTWVKYGNTKGWLRPTPKYHITS